MPVNDSPLDLPEQEPKIGLKYDSGNRTGSTRDLGFRKGADQHQDDSVSTAPDDTATDADALEELLVSGLLYPANGEKSAVEIRRGMTIRTTDGEVAGIVAGVINNNTPQKIKYILLSRPSQQLEYRIVPIALIQQVTDETVALHILASLVNTLAPWRK